MVRSRRLELPRVAPQRPQRCASTNSATTARGRSRTSSASGHLANHFGVHKPHLHLPAIFLKKNVKKPVPNYSRCSRNPDFPGFFKDFHKDNKFQKNVIKREPWGGRKSCEGHRNVNLTNPIHSDSSETSKKSAGDALKTFDILKPLQCFRISGIDCLGCAMEIGETDLPHNRHKRDIRWIASHSGT